MALDMVLGFVGLGACIIGGMGAVGKFAFQTKKGCEKDQDKCQKHLAEKIEDQKKDFHDFKTEYRNDRDKIISLLLKQ